MDTLCALFLEIGASDQDPDEESRPGKIVKILHRLRDAAEAAQISTEDAMVV